MREFYKEMTNTTKTGAFIVEVCWPTWSQEFPMKGKQDGGLLFAADNTYTVVSSDICKNSSSTMLM